MVRCLACILLLFFLSKAEAQTARPNILLILTDDLGYHDVSYYGTKDLRTPNIDQLCKAGMRFDNFYANSPVCSPTRASLMTGRYPDYVGVPGLIRSNPNDNWGYLDPSAILLPAILKKAGYHTALIGKWNLGLESPNLPNEKGFDLFHGWLEDMMEDYTIKRRSGKNYMRLNKDSIDPKGHATDVFTDWSIDYLRKRAKEKDPFFLFLSYNAPHFPVQPPQDYIDKVKKREPGISETRAKLVAFIEQTDDAIGRVIATLKETGQYENTLIIFTSDNGGHLPTGANNGPARDGKQSMYEGGLRVPALFTWPSTIRPGTVSQQINLSMDIFPTLAELAGVTIDHQVEGRSFLQTLLGNQRSEEDRVLYFTRREGGSYGGKAYHAIRQGDWKLLQNSPYQPMELYNLKDDPMEKNDLVKKEPGIVKKLNAELMKHIQQGGRVPWQH
ncbi:MAG TPA: sulfatase-like hydrolase/transferase [Chitinophagaceae bacterium]|nr:sulfatase-like hydrolase/transferase [Chitinophagaceae bacterium]